LCSPRARKPRSEPPTGRDRDRDRDVDRLIRMCVSNVSLGFPATSPSIGHCAYPSLCPALGNRNQIAALLPFGLVYSQVTLYARVLRPLLDRRCSPNAARYDCMPSAPGCLSIAALYSARAKSDRLSLHLLPNHAGRVGPTVPSQSITPEASQVRPQTIPARPVRCAVP
jgi:hypothetical protein